MQLQVVCNRLWERLPDQPDNVIQWEEVEQYGNIDRALVDFYESALTKARDAASSESLVSERHLRRWFSEELITPMETRGLVMRGPNDTAGLSNAAVDALEAQHLIRADMRAGARWYELSHDRMVEPILKSNRGWEQEQENKYPWRPIARQWETTQSDTLLYRGKELQTARAWLDVVEPGEVELYEREFILASLQAQQMRVRRQRIRMGVSVLGVIIILAMAALTLWAIKNQQEAETQKANAVTERDRAATAQANAITERDRAATAEANAIIDRDRAATAEAQAIIDRDLADQAAAEAQRQARLARAGQLAMQAQDVPVEYPQRRLLLAVEAINTTWTVDKVSVPAAEQALRDALQNAGGLPLDGYVEWSALDFSLDGRWLAIASEDGAARVWNLHASVPEADPLVLAGSGDAAPAMALDPNGRWVATGSENGLVQLWDLQATTPEAAPLVLAEYKGIVTALAFSSDGRWLAAGSTTDVAQLWDMAASQPAPVILRDAEDDISTLAFSSDGRWLAVGSRDNAVRLWPLADPQTAPLVLEGYIYPGESMFLDFSPDGRWLVTKDVARLARVWNLYASEPQIAPFIEEIDEWAFSPDGHWLATSKDATLSPASNGMTQLWDLRAANPQATLLNEWVAVPETVSPEEVTAMAFSADGRWLSTGSWEGIIRIWNLQAAAPEITLRTLEGHTDGVGTLVFSPDGRWLFTKSSDNTLRLWDLQAPAPISTSLVLDWFLGSSSGKTSFGFSPNSRWLANIDIYDGSIHLWDLQAANPTNSALVLRGQENTGNSAGFLAFSPDSHWLLVLAWSHTAGNTARLWDLRAEASMADPLILPGQESVIDIVFSPEGRWLTTVSGYFQHWSFTEQANTVQMWDLGAATPEMVRKIVVAGEPAEEQLPFAISQDGRWMATGYMDGVARVWDLHAAVSETATLVLEGHTEEVSALAFSPDAGWLATGSGNGVVQMWDLQADSPEAEPLLREGDWWINALAFSPEGRWLVVEGVNGSDRMTWLWDLHATPPQSTLLDFPGGYGGSKVAVSPDGRWVGYATGRSDLTARVWDIATGKMMVLDHQSNVFVVAFSPNSRWLATEGGGGAVRIWDLHAAAPEATSLVLKVEEEVGLIAFSPDGRWLATGSYEKVRLWDLHATGQDITPSLAWVGYINGVSALAFSPDGQWLATGNKTGPTWLWRMDLDTLMALACHTAGRNLSLHEWELHFPGEVYRQTCAELPLHPSFIEAGQAVARNDSIEKAITFFTQTLTLVPDPILDPETEARQLIAPILIEQGQETARAGEIVRATIFFSQALALDPGLGLTPEEEAYRYAAQGLVIQGEELRYAGEIETALATYKKAQTYDPNVEISAWNLTMLCWSGSIQGYADEVLFACEEAVALASADVYNCFRFNRGLARALTGDTAGAIEDFKTYVEWSKGHNYCVVSGSPQQHEAWIAELEAGRNPFDEKTLRALREE